MKKGKKIAIVLIFLVGLGMFSYPIVSNLYTSYVQSHAINNYRREMNKKSAFELLAIQGDMAARNEGLRNGFYVEDPFASRPAPASSSTKPVVEVDIPDGPLNALEHETGSPIGILHIPKLRLECPIYDNIGEIQLKYGLGVIPGTSTLMGGINNRSVITGHRGLPTGKLFTDLPSMEIGDLFLVEVAGEIHAYTVIEIETIVPTDVESLNIVPGKDLVTLLTCTPYMINSHRLLVTGERTAYDANQPLAVTDGSDCCIWILLLLGIIILLLLIITFILARTKKQNKKYWDKYFALKEKEAKAAGAAKEAPKAAPKEAASLADIAAGKTEKTDKPAP